MPTKKKSDPVEHVEFEETFTVTLDTGQKGDADIYEEALAVGRALLGEYPEASFFGIAKKYKRVT